MNREYLTNYAEDELSRQERHYERLRADNIEEILKDVEGYPDTSRFSKTNNPLVLCDTATYRQYGEQIWSQIPFAGTLIIPLSPSSERNFLMDHSFDAKDIDKMVDLAKDKGCIQFVLSTKPTKYEGLEHLQPIFQELRPPILTVPWKLFGSEAEYDKWINEFNSIAVAAYDTQLEHKREEAGESLQYIESMKLYQASIYAKINFLKMENAVADVKNYINAAPDYVISLLDYLGFLTENKFNPIRFNRNYSLETLRFYNSIEAQPASQFRPPVEIGSYLMGKITKKPQDYYDCLGVITQYEQNDLYKVLESLDKGVKNRNKEQVLENSEQLRVILDNIWDDAGKIKQEQVAASLGVGLTLGVVSPVATGGLSFEVGLLASLGFAVVDILSDHIVGNKIVRALKKDYINNIYDFRQKYSVDGRNI